MDEPTKRTQNLVDMDLHRAAAAVEVIDAIKAACSGKGSASLDSAMDRLPRYVDILLATVNSNDGKKEGH